MIQNRQLCLWVFLQTGKDYFCHHGMQRDHLMAFSHPSVFYQAVDDPFTTMFLQFTPLGEQSFINTGIRHQAQIVKQVQLILLFGCPEYR